MASRHGTRSGDIGNDLSSIAAALEDLAERIDRADGGGRSRRSGGDRASLDRIAAMVDDLGQEIGRAERPSDRSHRRRGAAPDRLEELSAALSDLEHDVATLSEAAGRGAYVPERHDQLDEIRRRLQALSGTRHGADADRPSHPLGAAANRPTDLDAAIAEISARQMELGRDRGGRDAIPRIPPRGGQADQLGQIGARLDELVRKLETAPRRVAAPAARFAEDDLKSLADRIAALSASRPGGTQGLDQLRAGIDDMRRSVDETARESTLRSIEAGYGHIIERLDDMLRRVPDRSRIDAMAQQMADLRRHLSQAAAPDQLERLERRLERLTEELNRTPGVDTAGLDQWFARVESRLGEIGQAIADSRAPGADEPWMSRLENQIAALAHRLDELAALQERPAPAVDAVLDEIARLRNDLAAHSQHEIERLELQIGELADRLNRLGPGTGDDGALRQLEDEVRLLAQRLDAGGQPHPALAHIEESLAELQAMVAENRRESIEAARQAAHEVASRFAGTASAGDSDMVRRLKSELGQLQATALDSDHRTQEALEAVHDTLKRVVERISDLESRPPEPDDDEPLELRPTGTDNAMPVVDEQPGAQSGGWWASSRATATEDHRPLEPGSGKPELGSAEPLRPGQSRGAGDRKADFIAAARRAAQAAAAEGTGTDPAGSDGDKSGPLTRISRVLRKNKQPLMLAAAALVLTAGAYRYQAPLIEMAGSFVSGDRAPTVAAAPEALPAELGPAPADDPIRDVLTASGQMLPDDLRNRGQVAANDAFAPPAGVESRFGAAPSAPSPSGFAAAGSATVAAQQTDPRTTASIAPVETPEPVPADSGEAATVETPAAPVAPSPAEAVLPAPQIGPQLLRQAAASGDPAAQYEVAVRYAEGSGGTQDLAEAALWYERAATRGLAPAQYRLGSLYERGIGLARDRNLARLWYSKAAEQGNARAMHNLAVLLSEGIDNRPDYAQALEWFNQAAAYDVRDSQYNLGVIYARGLGTEQDLARSYKWFAIAALGGDKDAAARRDEVAAVMEPDRIAALRAEVAAWKPTPLVGKANTVSAPEGGWRDGPATVVAAAASDLIRQAQTLLARRGFDVGPADGLDGPRTRDAVIAFQRLAGLTPNGIVDTALIEALGRDSL